MNMYLSSKRAVVMARSGANNIQVDNTITIPPFPLLSDGRDARKTRHSF